MEESLNCSPTTPGEVEALKSGRGDSNDDNNDNDADNDDDDDDDDDDDEDNAVNSLVMKIISIKIFSLTERKKTL